jgi:hypothetical protein
MKGTTGVAIPIPNRDGTQVFERKACSQFDVVVERDEGLRVGHIAEMSGHVMMDCVTTDARHVQIKLAFVACR